MKTENKKTEKTNKENMKYFKAFFEEKEVSYASWELIDQEGTYHYINSEIVIEAIQTAFTHEMQTEIRNKLVQIDFHNAPVLPFLKYVANYMINNIGGAY